MPSDLAHVTRDVLGRIDEERSVITAMKCTGDDSVGRSWTLYIPAPTARQRSKATGNVRAVPAWLTMNDRLHWRSVDRRKAEWRARARLAAGEAGLPLGVAGLARLEARLHFRRPVRRDPINWHPTIKPCIDELVSLDFIPDDSPAYLHCEDCPHIRLAEPLGPGDDELGRLDLVVTILERRAA